MEEKKEIVSPGVCASKSVCVCATERGHILHEQSRSLIHTPTSVSPSIPFLYCSLLQIESEDLPETIPDNHT